MNVMKSILSFNGKKDRSFNFSFFIQKFDNFNTEKKS